MRTAFRYALIGSACLLTVGIVVADYLPQTSATNPTQPVVLRQATFNIPFAVGQAAGGVSEVQLCVSTDRGASWQLAARQQAAAGHFQYRAPSDGHYWFASRVVDRFGQAQSMDQLQPVLQVVVDTTQPKLQFNAVAGDATDVMAAWQITDENLVSNTFKIEYQDRPGGAWRKVAVDAQQLDNSGALVGRMTWLADTASRSIVVRAEVADRAGNRSVISRQVSLPPMARHGLTQQPEEAPPDADPYAGLARNDGSVAWPTNNETPRQEEFVSTPAPFDPLDQRNSYPPVRSVTAPPVADPPRSNDIAATRLPPINDEASSGATPAVAALPEGDVPQMTNSLRFHLDYIFDAVGPAGVDEVQLWGTRDYGQTWSTWTIDEDKQSPVAIAVEEEGVYGFRVVVVGNNGLAGSRPRTGDQPDVWVGVDKTKPSVRVTGARYGKGARAGQLEINWDASDAFMASESITLQYAEHETGPWTTIAAGLPNTGRHHWNVNAGVPQRVFLRVEAFDMAGNIAEHQLRDPVNTTGLAPKARIRAVRPASETARSGMLWNPYY